MALKQANLEDVFLELTEEADTGKAEKSGANPEGGKDKTEKNASDLDLALKTAEAALAETDESRSDAAAANPEESEATKQ